ncbi:MAG: enoyl-CoA hydratase/isomerase family protein [Bdellovibrionaceae bacterium]|nr:enoyl-CoA hydratase/isomerase family protein [Pseudobdellovibrionaceae bacterium]
MKFVKIIKNFHSYVVELNRPEKKNAFHPEMIKEITMAFTEIQNTSVRFVELLGAGKSFCAGADLEWMKSMKDFSFEQNKADSLELFKMFETISQCHVPIIAKVQGHVMGGANGLLSMCDVVAAEHNTLFSFSEVRLGLVPSVISPFILSKMQKSVARSLMITGRIFSAEEAYHGGLIEFCGEMSEVDNFLEDVRKSLFSAGPEAVKDTISLIGAVENCYDWDQVKELTTDVISKKRISPEGQEGLKAFFEKRKPEWSVKK